MVRMGYDDNIIDKSIIVLITSISGTLIIILMYCFRRPTSVLKYLIKPAYSTRRPKMGSVGKRQIDTASWGLCREWSLENSSNIDRVVGAWLFSHADVRFKTNMLKLIHWYKFYFYLFIYFNFCSDNTYWYRI